MSVATLSDSQYIKYNKIGPKDQWQQSYDLVSTWFDVSLTSTHTHLCFHRSSN